MDTQTLSQFGEGAVETSWWWHQKVCPTPTPLRYGGESGGPGPP
jgi:hypothetical protein